MTTLILPGYSLKNKDWALSVKKELPNLQMEVNFWPHWDENNEKSEGWIKDETEKIISNFEGKKFNILAKSVGTFVTMNILNSKKAEINKLILCGIPVKDLDLEDFEFYKALKDFPKDKLLIIQNDKDNHGSVDDLSEMLNKIELSVNVTVKQKDDHEYPYFTDFQDFLTN